MTTLSVEPGDEADVFVAVVLGEAFHKIKKKTPLAVFAKHFAAGNALDLPNDALVVFPGAAFFNYVAFIRGGFALLLHRPTKSL